MSCPITMSHCPDHRCEANDTRDGGGCRRLRIGMNEVQRDERDDENPNIPARGAGVMTAPDPEYAEAMRELGWRQAPEMMFVLYANDAAAKCQRLVDDAVAEAVKKERERMAQAIDVVFTWWDDDYEHGHVEPFFRNGVKRACFLMRDHLTAGPEEGTRDE